MLPFCISFSGILFYFAGELGVVSTIPLKASAKGALMALDVYSTRKTPQISNLLAVYLIKTNEGFSLDVKDLFLYILVH